MFVVVVGFFLRKHKAITAQPLFSLVALEKGMGESCGMCPSLKWLLAFLGLPNPSGGSATELSLWLWICWK